jgi:hypothetical protein
MKLSKTLTKSYLDHLLPCHFCRYHSRHFFEYFTATYPILKGDPTLWCVSAWNDNGKNGMVEDDPGKI